MQSPKKGNLPPIVADCSGGLSRLQPLGDSEQPIFSNFAMAQGASGMVFIDFGFLEPSALPAFAQMAQAGGKVPEVIKRRLS